ncbi:hypothetical protein [Paenibacillus caui]|uniref:hypothetical protein n=1 Tax=Paenibacillus caui TaxID=2873927 RepID=UPI001CA9E751|nr:hypothetical protein [Paenibacillus caui]
MYKFILFLHILGALSLGFYLVLPFVAGGIARLSAAAREGMLSAVGSLNRYAQYGLVLQLLTGIYLVIKGEYTVLWTIVVTVLFLLAGALSGMLGKPLRLAKEASGKSDSGAPLSKIRSYSSLLALTVLVLTFFMIYRHII